LLLSGVIVFVTIFNENELSIHLISFFYSIDKVILLLIVGALSFFGVFAFSVSVFVNNKEYEYLPHLFLGCFFLNFFPLDLLSEKPASGVYISKLSSDIKKIMIKKEKVVCDFGCVLVEKFIDSNGAFAPYTYGEINKIREHLEIKKNESKELNDNQKISEEQQRYLKVN
jgi:hypothetical protein